MTVRNSQHLPPQSQSHQPGRESEMIPKPEFEPRFRGADKLKNKVVLITGGDSGIGRAVAVHMAREGADIAIVYLEEHDDAAETARHIKAERRRCISISGDVSDENFCRKAVTTIVEELGRLDVLINNAAERHMARNSELLDIPREQLEKTFASNIFGCFYMTTAALPHLKDGAAIINTASVTAYKKNCLTTRQPKGPS
jgi:NAD(P)-dependent dehydrogenase (short-subunit alcohol dehydrogenase family)